MFKWFRQWRYKQIISKSEITDAQWAQAFSKLPILERYSQSERDKLRDIAILLLHQKSFSGARGLQLNDEMKLMILLQAALPILNLGVEWYRGWVSIIVYPDNFIPLRTVTDDAGVVHQNRAVLSGESWQRGPVILAWEEVATSGIEDGSNLVIHEFTHKLDMLNGDANGFPPLHRHMSKPFWTDCFSAAYHDLSSRIEHGKATVIDGYAATSPAEFFAVLSEVFFEKPSQLESVYPVVYELLCEFYRQNPNKKRM